MNRLCVIYILFRTTSIKDQKKQLKKTFTDLICTKYHFIIIERYTLYA